MSSNKEGGSWGNVRVAWGLWLKLGCYVQNRRWEYGLAASIQRTFSEVKLAFTERSGRCAQREQNGVLYWNNEYLHGHTVFQGVCMTPSQTPTWHLTTEAWQVCWVLPPATRRLRFWALVVKQTTKTLQSVRWARNSVITCIQININKYTMAPTDNSTKEQLRAEAPDCHQWLMPFA